MTKSNEPTIDQMNEAIALFMNQPRMHPSDRRWHKDWNCLMPVWKKAGKILFDIRGDLIGENYLDAHRITKAFIDACQKVEIENAHSVVYNAIQLISGYNQQKQKDGTE